MRRFLSLFTMLMLCGVLAFGQNRVVTGRVTDANGAAIAFATITETGTGNVVVADGSGNYTIRLRGNGGVTITATGYTATSTNAPGNNGSVSLVRGEGTIEEVVVTALGIQRQKKQIGYSTAKIGNDELIQAAPVNVANGLQGKVSGLNITTLNSGVFEDVKINLRGIRSLTGNNNPLLLLDGVQTPLSYLSSINPQDIKDVDILKGAASAAIYGPDARNGVIVVTTKQGSANGAPVVTLSRTTQFSSVSFYPEFQTTFGTGFGGAYIPYENWSWGPRFDGSVKPLGAPLNDGTQNTYVFSPNDSRKQFFETGSTNQTDVSYAAKDFFLSIQDAKIKGIVPNDENRRTGIRLNAGREYNKLKVNFGVNYIQNNYDVFDDAGMSVGNTQDGALAYGLMNLIFNTNAAVNLQDFRNINDKFSNFSNYYNRYGINPYFALDTWRKTGVIDNLVTNADLSYKFNSNFAVTWRVANTSRNTNYEQINKGVVAESPAPNQHISIAGTVGETSQRTSRLSSEVFATYNKKVRDFGFGAILGTYLREDRARSTFVGNSNLVVPGLFNVANRSGELVGSNFKSLARTVSAYGQISVSYKGWLNAEVTGRNDVVSVLDPSNNSFFYPAVSGSFVVTDAIPSLKSGNFLSFMKLRAAVGKTGNADISPYLLNAVFGQSNGFPYGGLPGFSEGNTSYDPLLKPEFTNNKEIGLQMSFLKNRVEVEATAYRQKNTNQIIGVSTSVTTGYSNAQLNAASFINEGLEFDLKLTPLLKLGELKVNFRGNASLNNSEVLSIYPGLDNLGVGGFVSAGNYAIVGRPAFVWQATDYKRDSATGLVIVDRVTGLPSKADANTTYGRTAPKWIVGLTPSFSFRNFTLSAVGEYKTGHQAYSQLANDMAWTGVSKATAQNGRERFVFPNSGYYDGSGKIVKNTDVVVNDVETFYTGVYREVNANFLFSAASWRIREVSLQYDFPNSTFNGSKFFKGASITINARNLALFLPKSNQYVDPDFSTSATTTQTSNSNGIDGSNSNGFSNSQVNPPTRVIGINFTARF